MIKAEWTNKDSLDLQQPCNKLATNLQPNAHKSLDAVEVVRCKDCRYSKPNDGGSDTLVICERLIEQMKWLIDDFCSYGERKEQEHE